tara:strand:+ start:81 stop:263 length:183 start_codon:yes stop_codon:yes gene_type:complete
VTDKIKTQADNLIEEANKIESTDVPDLEKLETKSGGLFNMSITKIKYVVPDNETKAENKN